MTPSSGQLMDYRHMQAIFGIPDVSRNLLGTKMQAGRQNVASRSPVTSGPVPVFRVATTNPTNSLARKID
jgi:hypothetical protein